MITSKKCNELNLSKKVELIKYLDYHSVRQTSENFGLSSGAVCNIKKRKDEYLQIFSLLIYK
jgi:hypothetical protein